MKGLTRQFQDELDELNRSRSFVERLERLGKEMRYKETAAREAEIEHWFKESDARAARGSGPTVTRIPPLPYNAATLGDIEPLFSPIRVPIQVSGSTFALQVELTDAEVERCAALAEKLVSMLFERFGKLRLDLDVVPISVKTSMSGMVRELFERLRYELSAELKGNLVAALREAISEQITETVREYHAELLEAARAEAAGSAADMLTEQIWNQDSSSEETKKC